MPAGADAVIIPEIHYDINKIADKVRWALLSEKQFSIVVVAEGARTPSGNLAVNIETEYSPDGVKYKGVGDAVAKELERILNETRDENGYAISETIMDVEARAAALSHIQRGGQSSAFDRILCTRYGSFAVDALVAGDTAHMVALRGGQLTTVPLEEVIPSSSMQSNFRPVDPKGELVTLAKNHRHLLWRLICFLNNQKPPLAGLLCGQFVRVCANCPFCHFNGREEGSAMCYFAYSDYLKNKYGEKVYKLPINLPVTCPNRDGTKGVGGCIFCSGAGASYELLDKSVPVREQLLQNMAYMGRRFGAKKFIAYFQNYSNTYLPVDEFAAFMRQAVMENVVEISVSTRPRLCFKRAS